jgi:hypothetical protein
MGEIDKPVPEDLIVDTQLMIKVVCQEVCDTILAKNEAYGDSAVNPVRIFSKADPIEQINVRLDDKISRLMNGKEYANEDTEFDLLGYLILKRVARRLKTYEKEKFERDIAGSNGPLPEDVCPCGGEGEVLERLGGPNHNPQHDDRVCACEENRTTADVDPEDFEYAPTIQRNVFSSIVARPQPDAYRSKK